MELFQAMTKKLNFLWRQCGTGLGFLFFSLGGFVLSVTAFPCIALLSRTEEKRINRTRKLIHMTFRLFIFCLTRAKVIGVTITGAERLKHSKGCLVVSNHPSLLDVVFLVSVMPKAQCIVKHELWDHKYYGGVMRAAGYIRNDGDPENMLSQCKKALDSGHDIVIFPEGTRTIPGSPHKFQRGFANIAALCPCDIQLASISSYPPSLTKGSHWYEVPDVKAQFDVTIEEHLDMEAYLGDEPRSKAVRKLTRELEQYYDGKVQHG
jgi:1-acyl-sn-glycerol-3-phosphate acyltransferase